MSSTNTMLTRDASTSGLRADFAVRRRDFLVKCCLEVLASQTLVLFGPSGSGKTTIVEAIAGLCRLDQGSIWLGETCLSSQPDRVHLELASRRVGLVRQPLDLFPHLTVEQNVAYSLLHTRASRSHLNLLRSRIARALSDVGLDESFGPIYPRALSQGQRERVVVARLLTSEIDLLLLDEPFRALDGPSRRSLLELVQEVFRKIPIIIVTHQFEEAQAFAGEIVLIERGTVLEVGVPSDVLANPATPRVAQLMGCEVIELNDQVILAVHPDSVELLAKHESVPSPGGRLIIFGTVDRLRPKGGRYEARIQVREVNLGNSMVGLTQSRQSTKYVAPVGCLVSVTLDHLVEVGTSVSLCPRLYKVFN